MRGLYNHIKSMDWVLTGLSVALVGVSLVSLYSSSLGRDGFTSFEKQIIFLLMGVFVMFFVSLFDWRMLKNNSFLIILLYALGVIALTGLLLFAPEIRGSRRWFEIGGFFIGPAEYVKLVLILLLAKYFSMRHREIHKFRHIVLSGIYFGIPVMLVFLQPDLGTALLMAIIWVIMLLISGIKLKHFFALVGVAVLVFSFGWAAILQDHQRDRVHAFVEPELDPLGIGWSQLQAKIAIGNGGVFGQGLGEGTQTQHGFLSEPHTDFIFSAVAEEFGLIGVSVLFLLFLLLVGRILKIGLDAQSNFPKLFATGFATLLIMSFFVNIGMNLGILPIVGLPLPFVSYGGSALLMSFVGLGILQSIKTH